MVAPDHEIQDLDTRGGLCMNRAMTWGIGALALAATTLPAAAADLGAPVTKAPAFVPAPAFNWTGFYLGVGVGGRWTNTDWDTTCLVPGFFGTATCPNDPA